MQHILQKVQQFHNLKCFHIIFCLKFKNILQKNILCINILLTKEKKQVLFTSVHF